jgi:transposase
VRQWFKEAGVSTRRPELRADELAIVADYLSGTSLDLTASKASVSTYVVRRLVARAGHTLRPAKKNARRNPETVAKAERAAQLYATGMKAREIAAELGLCAPEMVYRLLAIAGVKPKRQHAAHPQAEARAA